MKFRHLSCFPFLLLIALNVNQSAADCPMITAPAGGYALSGCSTRTNSVCSIQCTANGVIQSQICQANGFWSGPAFNCYGGTGFTGTGFGGSGFGNGVGTVGQYIPNNQGFIGSAGCTNLAAPLNGFYSGNCSPGVTGASCAFGCRTGFMIRGAAIVSCLTSGSWSANPPTCVPRSQTRWYYVVRRWFG